MTINEVNSMLNENSRLLMYKLDSKTREIIETEQQALRVILKRKSARYNKG